MKAAKAAARAKKAGVVNPEIQEFAAKAIAAAKKANSAASSPASLVVKKTRESPLAKTATPRFVLKNNSGASFIKFTYVHNLQTIFVNTMIVWIPNMYTNYSKILTQQSFDFRYILGILNQT